jgi:hypothetical protein
MYTAVWIAVGVAVAAAGLLVVRRARRTSDDRSGSESDLGQVSDQWLAQARGSRDEQFRS